MDMGFSRSQCKAALKKFRNNIDRALDALLMNGEQFIGVDNSEDSGEEGRANAVDPTQQLIHQ